jgi:hypothetical protein
VLLVLEVGRQRRKRLGHFVLRLGVKNKGHGPTINFT